MSGATWPTRPRSGSCTSARRSSTSSTCTAVATAGGSTRCPTRRTTTPTRGCRRTRRPCGSPSQRLDSQSIGPGESYNLEIEGGAGGVQQSAGDFLYHCHIAKHYVSGMWGLLAGLRHPSARPGAAHRPAAPTDRRWTPRGLIGKTFRRRQDHREEPRRLDPAAAARRPGSLRDWAGRHGDGLEGRRDVAPSLCTSGHLRTRRSTPTHPAGLAGQPNLLAIDQNHMVGQPSRDPVQPAERPTGVPAAAYARRASDRRSRRTATPARPTSVRTPISRRRARVPIRTPNARTGCVRPAAPQRTYNVVAIAKPIQRTPTFVDPDGKIFVLAAGQGPRSCADGNRGEPLAIRANQGDCVAVTLTNEIPDDNGVRRVLQGEHPHPPRAVRRAGLGRRQHRLRLRALGASLPADVRDPHGRGCQGRPRPCTCRRSPGLTGTDANGKATT